MNWLVTAASGLLQIVACLDLRRSLLRLAGLPISPDAPPPAEALSLLKR
jgi:hypothetical protein